MPYSPRRPVRQRDSLSRVAKGLAPRSPPFQRGIPTEKCHLLFFPQSRLVTSIQRQPSPFTVRPFIASRLLFAALWALFAFVAPDGAGAAESTDAVPEANRVTGDFDSAGVKIHYVVVGKGEPVILIHGLTASIAANWELPGMVAELAKKYQVIALDCRGHGHSDKPDHDGDYGQKMVDDVLRLMDHLQVPKARFVGYSMGGMITMKILTAHPERVTSAVLGGMGWVRNAGEFDHFMELGMSKGKAPSSFVACFRGFAEFAISEADVKAVKVPVEIVVGESDPVRRLYVAPLEKIRPDWPVHVVAGAGHILCIFKPDFKAQVQGALERAGK
jgi:pimeloyl-ACP methyl ester carboxylesterase